MVGLEVQGAVSVRGLPVHHSIKVAIILPLEQDVQEREGSILLDLHCELDGWTKAVEVAQELLNSAFPQNAEGVVNISLPYARPALIRGKQVRARSSQNSIYIILIYFILFCLYLYTACL